MVSIFNVLHIDFSDACELNMNMKHTSTISSDQVSRMKTIHLYMIRLFQLSRSYAPEVSEVQEDLMDGIKLVQEEEDGSEYHTLSNTDIIINTTDDTMLQITGRLAYAIGSTCSKYFSLPRKRSRV